MRFAVLKILLIGKYDITFLKQFLYQIDMYVIFSNRYINIDNVNNCKYCIIDIGEETNNLQTVFDVIIFKNEFFSNFNISDLIKKETIAIINSEDLKAKEFLKNNSINCITCGLCERDTVTASSISDDCVTVCIQRKINSLKNKIIETQEYNISGKYYPNDIYPILAGSFLKFLV